MIDMNVLAEEIHANAVEKGFWDVEDAEEKAFACMHCELSEAVQEDRLGKPMLYDNDIDLLKRVTDCNQFDGRKPEGVAVELADFVMRLLDITVYYGQTVKMDVFDAIGIAVFDNAQDALLQIVSGYTLPKLVNYTHLFVEKYKINRDVNAIHVMIKTIDVWLKHRGYDLYEIIRLKMGYNKSRSRLHGRRY